MKKSQRVKVIRGSFKGEVGKVVDVLPDGRLNVLLPEGLKGRACSPILPADHVKGVS